MIPSKLISGDSYSWIEPLVYGTSADAEYFFALKHADSEPVILTGTAEADGIRFEIDSKTTLAAGDYSGVFFMRENGKRTVLSSVPVTVLPDPLSVDDSRSQVKRTLDLLNAAIENRADASIMSKSVDGITLSYCSLDQLISLRDKYANLYEIELNDGRPVLPGSAVLTWRGF